MAKRKEEYVEEFRRRALGCKTEIDGEVFIRGECVKVLLDLMDDEDMAMNCLASNDYECFKDAIKMAITDIGNATRLGLASSHSLSHLYERPTRNPKLDENIVYEGIGDAITEVKGNLEELLGIKR